MAQLTPLDFIAKWQLRFQPNTTFQIEEADFQEFATDIADTFGVRVENVPEYVPGTTYPQKFLVRYTPVGGQEAFYYSLTAGQLTAPGPGNLVDWKVVPGPTSATALSQEINLSQAQGIDQDQVVAGRSYLIDFGPDAQGNTRIVSLIGVSNNSFATSGTLEINGQRWDVENVQIQAGTYDIRYTRSQLTQLLATKQGAVTQQVQIAAFGPANSLLRTNFDTYVQLITGQDGELNLPPCTLADVGRILALHNYSGPGSQATQTLQATLGTDPSPTYLTKLPRTYVALLEVVRLVRGNPWNDTVATYAVLGNSRVEPVSLPPAYTDAQARAAPLNRVAPVGTTTVTLTVESAVDYGTAASGSFTIDATNCQVGKEAHFALAPAASAPNFLPAPAGQPYKFRGTNYAAGYAFSYTLRVFVDRIEVIVLAD